MFTLDQVVPWGRSFDEYSRMFALGDAEQRARILGCGDGPASFNAEATRRGMRVTSCDPIYRWNAAELRQRIDATSVDVLAQTTKNAHEFVWTSIRSVAELADVRQSAMRLFLDDYESGRTDGRYVEASLPDLPFADQTFDLALCSHLLFLYTTQLGAAFHLAAVGELCRVARDVRIFPLLALGGERSAVVDAVVAACQTDGFTVSIERVPYEFQRGGFEMMRIGRATPRL